MRNVHHIASGISLLFAGLFAGFLLGVLVLELSLRDFGAGSYTQVRQVELVGLDDLASATLLPALAATVLLVVVARGRGAGGRLGIAAGVLLLAVLVTTLAVNLPINSAQLGWNVDAPPADWADVRDRWQIAHAARTVAAVSSFACLGLAALAGRPIESKPRRTP
ncbi:anthrone oxygenase family protein [Microlunatus parietis]|uniref:Putative membrane protein n=1 Tax=Microlunatus parietis TaxID=682979 RepID=A0A7Y9LA33_9ACTN|nr:anthrone oxygenase family protein [Microlunatus parietis]NYE70217.1 putative membrane protein [Microlunatus parietis]